MTTSPSLLGAGLKGALSYRKFAGDALSAVVIDSGYHLHGDALAVLPRLGCRAHALSIREDQPVREVVMGLLRALVDHRPDFVFSVNHLGFDGDGHIASILEDIEMPVAVWYVDSPLIILQHLSFPAPKVSTLFMWERTQQDWMRGIGAQDVHHLPLGTDPAKFGVASAGASDKRLTFVGDSRATAISRAASKLGPADAALARSLADEMNSGVAFDAMLERHALSDISRRAERWKIWELAIWTATAQKRLRSLKALEGPELHIYGDEPWSLQVPRATFHGLVASGAGAAGVYASSEVNLNSTCLQMSTGVNQRVFDVPAAGGFVLSDNQADMHELFEPGKESAVYSSDEELADKARYFLSHETERRAIAEAAKRRVLAEHTYEKRFEKLLAAMRARHGRSGCG